MKSNRSNEIAPIPLSPQYTGDGISWMWGMMSRSGWMRRIEVNPQLADWHLERAEFADAVKFVNARRNQLQRLHQRLRPQADRWSGLVHHRLPCLQKTNDSQVMAAQISVAALNNYAIAFVGGVVDGNYQAHASVVVPFTEIPEARIRRDALNFNFGNRIRAINDRIMDAERDRRGKSLAFTIPVFPSRTRYAIPEVVYDFHRMLIRALIRWMWDRLVAFETGVAA